MYYSRKMETIYIAAVQFYHPQQAYPELLWNQTFNISPPPRTTLPTPQTLLAGDGKVSFCLFQ